MPVNLIKNSVGAEKAKFKNLFFRMNYPERFVSRMAINIFVTVHLVATIVLLLSDVEVLFWTGVLSSLYFANRLIHYGRPDYEISKYVEGKENISGIITPRAKKIIFSGMNKSSLSGARFSLNLMEEFMERGVVRKIISDFGVSPEEFIGKLEFHISKDKENKQRKGAIAEDAEKLIVLALNSLDDSRKFIDHMDLLSVLHLSDDELYAVFDVFDIDVEKFSEAVNKKRRFHGKQ